MTFSIGDEVITTLASLQKVLTPKFLGGIDPIARSLADALRGGGKFLIMSNGGSAADAQHIAAAIAAGIPASA